MLEATVAWLAVAATGLGIFDGLDTMEGTTSSVGMSQQLVSWGYLAMLVLFSNGGAYSYFRRRLWPELTAANASAAGSS